MPEVNLSANFKGTTESRATQERNESQIAAADNARATSQPFEVLGRLNQAEAHETDANRTSTEHPDNDCSFEQSFEIIPPQVDASSNPIRVTPTMSADQHTEPSPLISQETGQSSARDGDHRQDPGDEATNKPRSNSETTARSIQSQIKKSGSFLARLQSSTSEEKDSSNIPSSIASAFSSLSSSLVSNFNLNSSASNGNSTINSNQNASTLTIESASTSTRLSQISETREDTFSKKTSIERKNLIGLTKLIVKDLISSSLSSTRDIDEGQNVVHLNNYFTLIDRVLKHGLKQNLLSSKSAGLWQALDSLPKYLKESTLMSESVRSLANTKTPDGRIRAWVRLAMMQKKLPDYLNELLANKNILLKDIYHDYAFMLNDEAHVFAGLIIGVNVINCNFFVKDANFDMMDEIIDLAPYLRVANSYDSDDFSSSNEFSDGAIKINTTPSENTKMLIDQNSYLEELNKRLESTINDLQSKMRALNEQNSKLEMEAKLSEARILKLQKGRSQTPSEKQNIVPGPSVITDALKSLIGGSESKQTEGHSDKPSDLCAKDVATHSTDLTIGEKDIANKLEEGKSDRPSLNGDASSQAELKSISSESQRGSQSEKDLQDIINEQDRELSNLRERASILEASYRGTLDRIKVLERDLDVQTSMNADKETTIKIYEKDIREKQSQVESLRASLSDAKKLNSDLSERLNETSTKLKDRVKSVSNLQSSLDKWKLENKTLSTRLQDKLVALKSKSVDLEKAMSTIEDLKKYNERINDELRRERANGHSSSVTVEAQTAQIAELTDKLTKLEDELKDASPYREQAKELEKRCHDYELSLEEVGVQLRESRLEVENLRENSAVFLDSQWMDSKQVKACASCELNFSVTRRKHHCRLCGNVFCQACSDNKMELASSSKPVRVCDICHSFLLAKFVKSSSMTSTTQ